VRAAAAAILLLIAGPASAQQAEPAAVAPVAPPVAVPTVRIVSDLGWSFRADVTVSNVSTGQRIDAWTLVLDWPGRSLPQVQGARMTGGAVPGRFTFEPPANAAPLAPGGSITFTVGGTPGDAGPPGVVRLDAVSVPTAPGAAANERGACRPAPAGLSFSTDKTWDGGYTGRIDIVNKGAAPIGDWLLTFTLDAAIGESWDGSVQSHTGSAYSIKPADYFRSVAPGAAARFVFNAQVSPGAAVPTPGSMRLYACG
jgi:hypothetical protein